MLPEISRSMLKNALVLGLFAIGTVGSVALLQQGTAERIAAAEREAQVRALAKARSGASLKIHSPQWPCTVARSASLPGLIQASRLCAPGNSMGGMWAASGLMGLAQPPPKAKRWVCHASARPSKAVWTSKGSMTKATAATHSAAAKARAGLDKGSRGWAGAPGA